ncbi:FtsX-like permease family protein [Hamadaea sp. NPDC051192]|uniref:ABC transporter permease n=1 Tax=Hamadaea sp. NPDC051192 TaxID=3154940 RepID=UPI003428414F
MRHRAGRSLLVLLMAAVATTAAAAVPAYVRAAQESVVRDLLGPGSATDPTITVQLPTTGVGAQVGEPLTLAEGIGRAELVLGNSPYLAGLRTGRTAYAETNLKLTNVGIAEVVTGHLVYQPGVCELATLTGRCPAAAGEVMVSARTAEHYKIAVGDRLPIALGPSADLGRTSKGGGGGAPLAGTTHRPLVVGLFTPKDALDSAWGSQLQYSPVPDPHLGARYWSVDGIYTGTPDDVEKVAGAVVRRTVVLRFDLSTVDDAGVGRLDVALRDATSGLSGQQMSARSAIPAVIVEIRKDQDAIAQTVPVGAVPLLVLALVVLMVLVAALTEERGPEIALARLHGYARGRVAAFGLAEVLTLITVAAPLGLLLSRLVLAAVAGLWLAPDTPAPWSWTAFAAVGIALLTAYAAAAVASRRVFRTRVINLLRRVPQRTTWRAGALEGAAVALAVAALVTTVQDQESGLAVLAAPLLAIVVGVAGGRLLSLIAAARVRQTRRRADPVGVLTSASLSRRPGRQRIVVVVAVAASLMGFSAVAWDVAAQARAEAANGVVGAPSVYRVSVAGPQQLLEGVKAAVPDGSAMGVVRRMEFYDGNVVSVIGVQSDRLAKTATWFGHSDVDLETIAAKLRPAPPAPSPVSGRLTVALDTTGLDQVPLMVAVEVRTGQRQQTVELGKLQQGLHEYAADVPEGELAVLKLIRPPAQAETVVGTLTIKRLSSAAGDVPIGGAGGWQPILPAGVKVGLTGDAELTARVEADGNGDIRIARLHAPKALPGLLAGPVPAVDVTDDGWPFMAFATQPQNFTTLGIDRIVPGASGHGILVDVDYGLAQAQDLTGSVDNGTSIVYEVWAGDGAPKDLVDRLAAHGIQVRSSQTLSAYEDRLGRRAPALALRLYGIGALVAILLALGIVLLAVRVGAEQRRYGSAALLVAGVPETVLRKAVRREFVTLLGWPAGLGFLSGVAVAVLLLPGIPLVTTGVTGDAHWQPAPGALAVVAIACLGCLLIALPVAVRLIRQARPELLRGEAR